MENRRTKEVQQISSLLPSSQSISPQTTKSNSNSISLYRDELTTKTVIHQVKKMKASFPKLPDNYFDILMERIKEKGFTDQRLRDAINNVIDNCAFPTPSIAEVVSFDKRAKIYSYSEICAKVDSGYNWNEFIKMPDRKAWITKVDADLLGIKKQKS